MKEDYPLFVHWYDTLNWILSTVENFPKKARFSVASRIAEQALDAMECVVEAIYTRRRTPLLDRFNMILEKQRILFRISRDRRYIAVRQYEHVAGLLEEAGKMAGGWRKATNEARRQSI